MAAALIAIVAMPILWASLMLLLALPGGLFLMALFDLLHDWVPVIPEMPYETAYWVTVSLGAFLAFIRPIIGNNKD